MQEQQLKWIQYNKSNPAKYYLVYVLGERDNHIIALLADSVPLQEVNLLRVNTAIFESPSLQLKVEWIKQYMPVSYKMALRSFQKNLVVENKSFAIKNISKATS
jgi:hypothetical protein